MAASSALRRLLGVLQLEEEQARRVLELAIAALRHWESALASAIERGLAGRRLVTASARSGEVADRLAGIQEARTALESAAILKARIAEAKREAALRQQTFLAKRVERRQAETLIEEVAARDAVQARGREQQSIDEWFLDRRRRSQTGGDVKFHCGDDE